MSRGQNVVDKKDFCRPYYNLRPTCEGLARTATDSAAHSVVVRDPRTFGWQKSGFTDLAKDFCRDNVSNFSVSNNRQAESLKYKLLGGLAVRRACYGVLRFIMESGAKGAEVWKCPCDKSSCVLSR